MLKNAAAINGYAIVASDGRLGSVSDFLFDDTNWLVRWLVVDTGDWLAGRKVLLPPSVLGRLDPEARDVSVRLTMRQVQDGPDIDTDQSVSRQMETHIYDHFGWNPYWGTGFSPGGDGDVPNALAPSPSHGEWRPDQNDEFDPQGAGDQHLRSAKAVTGYHILASDGEIGHVADFLIEDIDWSIRDLVVDTANWWSGTKVLISPGAIRKIDWASNEVTLDIDRQRIMEAPPYDASAPLDRVYAPALHRRDGAPE